MSALNWFEIPVTQLDRAREFYGHLYGQPLEVQNGMAVLPYDREPGGIGGHLEVNPRRKPSADGPLLFLAAQHMPGGLDGALGRVASAGGRVVQPRTAIGEHGFVGIVEDSEGNVVGLHAMS